MRKLLVSLALSASTLAAAPLLAQTSSSSAFAVDVNQTVTAPGLANVTVDVGPVVAVSGTAPPNFNNSNSVLSLNESATLNGTSIVGVQQQLNTGLLTTNATGTATGAQATATVNDLSTSLAASTIAGLSPSFLNLSATTLQSFSQASSAGGLAASGFTIIEGLSITGSALGGLTFSGNAFAAPAANTVLFSGGGLSIILNEQTSLGDGLTNIGISTNALAIRFNDFAAGTGLANGSIILGNSQALASVGAINSAVPEPATWAMMLIGFGAIGHSLRRRSAGKLLQAALA